MTERCENINVTVIHSNNQRHLCPSLVINKTHKRKVYAKAKLSENRNDVTIIVGRVSQLQPNNYPKF
ncbi:hypothetical protein L873DRAFT_1805270 [Choiromyces venosus 120613-1]|uniref:Uncharacterized protein n=1 Tax=Choiromyces venosus 120613-1 TaxID=1336337 RepID=A0A3N4JCX7_9PEZI|nr:hypothetical protein L873DRAFT_1822172 [Choiromyces venosus 120613-1]RPA92090.1 hypothetical protein L873DRAFT_1818199 [Choiromyces venosus 120613-1]RPA92883.1 hypothetical protein L873DRAFT_1816795 [Choiromyces venosus 120613-1]RPA96123.1 hypothetical protein L873DRAFT_1811747 [Choiromyces venosus 120613-1]RPA96187.1 hypothetical protein L873DRAFT_1811823 [Choiromyces venosus 120613-1]